MAHAPKVRPATLQDYAQITALQARNGLKTEQHRQAWTHLWTANPAYLEDPQSWPIGWVLETGDDKIVGHLGNVPLLYELESRRLRVAAARGWAVDPGYRAYSLSLLSQFYRQSADLLLFTSLGPKSAPAFQSKLFSAARVPVGAWNRSLYWITHYRRFVAAVLTKKSWTNWKLAQYPTAAALCVADQLRTRKHRLNGNVVIAGCPSFDERFEQFWQELRESRRRQLCAVRSREAMNWHFHFALRQGNSWIATASVGSKLLAYAVFKREDNPEHSLTRMRLADFFSLVDDSSLLPSLLLWGVERCRREGIHMLEALGNLGTVGEGFLGARVRQLPAWTYFYHAPNRALAETLADPNVWSPTLYDGDATL
jgi:hypothetical protein